MFYGWVKSLQDVQDFLMKNGNKHMKDEDAGGRTALMIACMQGDVEIVRFLLEERADPNKSCTDLSTPLHFACRPVRNKEDGVKQIPIIEMLVKHGAKITADIHGWTPLCYAALHKRSDIVEYLLSTSKEEVALSHRILAFEVCAFALSMFVEEHAPAAQAILRALKLREESETPVTPSIDSVELEACLGTRECKTTGELQVMGAGDEGKNYLKKQGFLIGARVLPDAVKVISLWPLLASIHNHDSTETYLRTCGFILRLESQSKVAIGTALHGMTYLIEPFRLFLQPHTKRLQPSNYSLYHSTLETYKEILQMTCFRNALHEAAEIRSDLRIVLAGVIGDLSGHEICPAIIRTIADLDGLLFKNTDYKLSLSMLEGLVDFYEGITSDGLRLSKVNPNREIEGKNITNMMQLAFLLLVEHGYPSLKHTYGQRYTLLHSFCYNLENFEFLDVIVPVVRKIIRYGCPVGVKTQFGDNVLDLAGQQRDYIIGKGVQKYDELIKLLKEELESVTSLQELAARVVLQNRIPYKAIVPKLICDLIEGDDAIAARKLEMPSKPNE